MRCPQCTFTGTDAEVDEHRATGVHNDEPQAGSNVRTIWGNGYRSDFRISKDETR